MTNYTPPKLEPGYTDKELIAAVREVLAAPERWTRESFARNARRGLCGPRAPDAVCWCLSGAAIAVCSPSGGYAEPVIRLRNALELEYGSCVWNDHRDRTHAEVLAKLDEAYARLP